MKFLLPLLLLLQFAPAACAAAKAKAAAPADISTPSQKLSATCPPPKSGPCALNTPSEESRWRALTPNVDIEPVAGGWLVDFSKAWKEGTKRMTLRVMSGSGSLREIDITFRK